MKTLKEFTEAYGRRHDAYTRDYHSSISGMGKHQSAAYHADGGANDEGRDVKEEVELDEAKSPQQKADFDRMMAGAMSRAAYNAKWKKPLKSDDKVIYGKNVKEELKGATVHKEEVELDEAIDPSEIASNPRMYNADTAKKAYYHKKATDSDKASLERHLDRHHGNKEWRKPVKEEVELDEATTGNEAGGYHGQHHSTNAAAAYKRAHALVKKHAGEAGHLKDVKKPGMMVKHYLDSVHGRHLKGNENSEYIKKDFGKFKKTYKPEMHEEVEQVNELSRDTLLSYANKVSLDSQKHSKDPTKRSGEKANRSVTGYAKAHDRLEKPVKEEVIDEDQTTSEYKVKKFVGQDGKTHQRKVRPHTVHFKNSKSNAEPDQDQNTDDKETMKKEQLELIGFMQFQESINTPLDEKFINGREYASHGLMHPDHAKHAIHQVTGREVDFYASKTGDKMSGKVTKNDGKSVHIQAHKELGDGKLHKFKVTPHLPKQQNEEAVDEALKGGQKNLDKNKNGKLDAQDFKMLRKEEENLEEKAMTDAQMKKREEIVKSMKKSYKDFVGRYGDRAKEVMYATATKKAMGEEADCDYDDKDDMKENAFDWKSGAHKTASSGKYDIKQVGNRTIVTRKYDPETGHSTGTDEPESTEKRGRGRPSGSKSGAKQKGSGKSNDYRGIPQHSLSLPNSNK